MPASYDGAGALVSRTGSRIVSASEQAKAERRARRLRAATVVAVVAPAVAQICPSRKYG